MSPQKTDKPQVTFEMPVEDLALNFPESVHFLTKHNIRCIRCGEPLWCSIGELFEQDKVENPQQLLDDLNKFIDEKYG